MQSKDQELLTLIQGEFPAVSKNIIQNEIRKNNGKLEDTRRTIQSISDSIVEADEILGEEQKEYQSSSSSEDNNEYESQEEDEVIEIDKICKPKVNEYMKETKEVKEEQSQEIFRDLTKDFIEKFPGVPSSCIDECLRFFYPNLGKIEVVLSEFQKQWVMYTRDYDSYSKGKSKRREKVKKEKKNKKDKFDLDFEINPELAMKIQKMTELLDNDMNDLATHEKKDMKSTLKILKKQIRNERKNIK